MKNKLSSFILPPSSFKLVRSKPRENDSAKPDQSNAQRDEPADHRHCPQQRQQQDPECHSHNWRAQRFASLYRLQNFIPD
jgi:hypothetical protein